MTQAQIRLIEEIHDYFNWLSDQTGKTLTEYNWRECCSFMLAIEEQLFPLIKKGPEGPSS